MIQLGLKMPMICIFLFLILVHADGGVYGDQENVFECTFRNTYDSFYYRDIIFYNVSLDRSSQYRLKCLYAESVLEISFESSSMEVVPKLVFVTFPSLQKVNMSYCEIKYITEGSLEHASRMYNLNLSGNYLEQLYNASFAGAHYLQILDLKSNNIEAIDSGTFHPLSNLQELYLENNKLLTVQPSLFVNNFRLRRLFLQNNQLETVEGAFPSSVEILDLSFNKLHPLNLTTFGKLTKLRKLNLQRAGVSNIQHGTFANQKDLQTLDISYNNMSEIDFGFFVSLTNLKTLYLEGNRLTTINFQYMKKIFPELRGIALADNDWACSFLVEMVLFFRENYIELLHRILPQNMLNQTNVEGYRCNDRVGVAKQQETDENQSKAEITMSALRQQLLSVAEDISELRRSLSNISAYLFGNQTNRAAVN